MERLKIRRYILLGLGLLAAAFIGWWVVAAQPGPVVYFSLAWIAVISLLLWLGNRFLTRSLDRVLPWSRWGNIRFFAQLGLALVYMLLLITATYYAIKTPLTGNPPTPQQIIVATAWGCMIFVPIFSIYFSLHFLRHWRKSELEVEKFHKETMRSQLDSLKNHLDPHFLFNNLNILASLIEKDQRKSKEFIQKFAEVYRSLLRSRADDLIPLYDEMAFIQSYIYLIKMRFEENIVFDLNLSKNSQGKMLPPLTLQMLVENAIKHNIVTETNPLTIEISSDEETLTVSNNVTRTGASESAGTGLENIRQRYRHFTERSVDVIESDGKFIVRIPLLEIEHHEGSYT